MLEYDRRIYWPSSKELPDSDDTPVDNELQELIPEISFFVVSFTPGV